MTTPSIQSLNGHLTQLNAILDATNIKDTECGKVKEYLLENFKYIYAGRQYAVIYRNPDRAELLQHPDFTTAVLSCLPSKLGKWYIAHATRMSIISDPHKPFLTEETLNIVDKVQHSAVPFHTLPQKQQDAVKMMLDFLKEFIGRSDDAIHSYNLKWLAQVARQVRTNVGLYLRGRQGLGKSTLSNFLSYVLGSQCVCQGTSDMLTGNFNYPMMGKSLVVFEELPTFSKAQWSGVSGKLKAMINSPVVHYEDKYKSKVQAKNVNNFIINTNVNSLKDADGRRYYVLDLNPKFAGNSSFFATLYKTCMNEETGFAFYCYLMELDVAGFNAEAEMPLTSSKKDAAAVSLSTTERFLKDCYVLKKKRLYQSVGETHGEYIDYCSSRCVKPLTKVFFNRTMKDLGFEHYKSSGTRKYKIEYATLRVLADKHNWIHDLDEADGDEAEGDDDSHDAEVAALRHEIEALKAQLHAAQQENAQLKASTTQSNITLSILKYPETSDDRPQFVLTAAKRKLMDCPKRSSCCDVGTLVASLE